MSTEKKIVIVDYESGNLFSVKHACAHVGIDPLISSDKKEIETADALILPGVGAFGDAMKNLEKLDLVSPIKSFIQSQRPFFGVCLGMQLLFEESEEFGPVKGLGIIKGTIKKFPENHNGTRMRIPQIAWNEIKLPENMKWDSGLLKGIQDNEFMYFVHSYYALPENTSDILAKTSYNGFEYCSAVAKDNVFATQFHPEKSGKKGLEIYNNFKNIVNKK